MRENLTSGSMWQGMGNQDMAKVLRHSQKKWRATGLPCLRLWHHPLTLPTFGDVFKCIGVIGQQRVSSNLICNRFHPILQCLSVFSI